MMTTHQPNQNLLHGLVTFFLVNNFLTIIGIIFAFFLNLLLMPFLLLPIWVSFFTVEPKEEVLVLFFGKLNTVRNEDAIQILKSLGL